MTAAAASEAFHAAQEETAYPPPSCSAFQGRIGSSEGAVTTWGTPCSSPARWPARLAYHVWECTRSVPAQLSAMARSTPRVLMAALAPASSARSAYDAVP